LTRCASSLALSAASLSLKAADASCSKPIAAGDRFSALRRNVEVDCLPRGLTRRASSSDSVLSGRKATCSVASPFSITASRNGPEMA
jgi:hypothetical protein